MHENCILGSTSFFLKQKNVSIGKLRKKILLHELTSEQSFFKLFVDLPNFEFQLCKTLSPSSFFHYYSTI